MLAEAEAHDFPKTAAVCEHVVAKLYEQMQFADLECISQAACLRIIKAVKMQSTSALDRLSSIRSTTYNGYGSSSVAAQPAPEIPSAETMLTWR